jgi:sugar phosphate isomerase/epimerase
MRDALLAIAAMGYRQVQWPATLEGLRPRDLDATARRGVRSDLARAELALSGVDVWIPTGHFLEPETLDRAVGALTAAIEFAASLAGRTPTRPVVSTQFPSAEERKAAGKRGTALADAIGTLAAIAEREGIDVVDHAVGAPGPVAWGLDPVLAFAASNDPVQLLVAGSSGRGRLRSVRLSDLMRSGLRGPIGEPGDARLDVTALQAALDVVGFDDAPVADARQWRDPAAGLARTVERWCGRTIAAPTKGTKGH